MNWIKTSKKLPPLGTYVLIKHTLTNWRDSDDQEGVQFDVAKRVKDINWKIPSNNLKRYQWVTFGPMTYFGQDVECWMPIDRKKVQESD